MVRKDASTVATDSKPFTKDSQTVPQQSSSATAAQQSPPAALLLPSTVVNIALHSLLMVTVPFALFFTAHFGGLDCESPAFWLVPHCTRSMNQLASMCFSQILNPGPRTFTWLLC